MCATDKRHLMCTTDKRHIELMCASHTRSVCEALHEAGHSAYLVGGCVRDTLMGREPHDWDICTSAMPSEVQRLFTSEGPAYGLKHGTVVVGDLEITTFRGDGAYSDGRRPDSVRLGVGLIEDLARRDFTINAMAMSLNGQIVDPFGGQADLERGVICCVGEPAARFAEDGLRILRGARFAAVLGFTIEPATLEGMRAGVAAGMLSGVSWERIRDELLKMLVAGSRGIEILRQCGALEVVLPEVARCVGVKQNRWHQETVYEHLLLVCDALHTSEPLLALAAILHDIGKPACAVPSVRDPNPGAWTFPGHEEVGAEMAEGVARRLRLSRAEREVLVGLVRKHGFVIEGVSDAGVRRWIRRAGGLAEDLLALRAADLAGRRSEISREGIVEAFAARVAAEKERTPRHCAKAQVNGHDVMAVLGISRGPEVGRVLARLEEASIENPELNREALLALVKTY